MQIYHLISATALPGKWGEARKGALAAIRYLNENSSYLGKYEILHPAGGPNNLHYWLCHYQSMADAENDMTLRGKDGEWYKVFGENMSDFVDVDNITSQEFKVGA